MARKNDADKSQFFQLFTDSCISCSILGLRLAQAIWWIKQGRQAVATLFPPTDAVPAGAEIQASTPPLAQVPGPLPPVCTVTLACIFLFGISASQNQPVLWLRQHQSTTGEFCHKGQGRDSKSSWHRSGSNVGNAHMSCLKGGEGFVAVGLSPMPPCQSVKETLVHYSAIFLSI